MYVHTVSTPTAATAAPIKTPHRDGFRIDRIEPIRFLCIWARVGGWGWFDQVFIKSTAGMRLLPTETQEAIYDSIYDALGKSSDWIQQSKNDNVVS